MTPPAAQLEFHRAALTGHCYRMLGSAIDADDAVQETMVRAWRGLDGFDGRAALRTWLYRIATNVCLDALTARGRRARPMEDGPAGAIDDDLIERPRAHWLEPIADHRAIPADADPAARVALRQQIRLAFVAALQHLPPKQRAALILTEVVGWSAAEVGATLDLSVAAVTSALQRARATIATLDPAGPGAPLTPSQRAVVDRYVAAFERYDLDALAALLRADVVQAMPPYTMWLQGRATLVAWMGGRGAGCRGSRLVPIEACGAPAFGQYRPDPAGGHRAWAILILELAGDEIAELTYFLDTETYFPRFGLPRTIG
jgi:RNA polymerase sigma-70 factor (ECF subfamily)